MLEAQSCLSQILTCSEKDDRVKLFVRGRYFSLLPRATGFGAHRAFCLSEYKPSITVRHNSVVLVMLRLLVQRTINGQYFTVIKKARQVYLQCALLVSEILLVYEYLLKE
jgi:hypothetical protein